MNYQDFFFSYNDFKIPNDYIIIILSFIFIVFSFWKGFLKSLLGLLTWIGSIIITILLYPHLEEIISNLLLETNIFNPLISLMIGRIISIPLIFLISFFTLKKIRQFFTSELDKKITGIFLDKFFGLIYGFIFSYIIFSTLLYGVENFDWFNIDTLHKRLLDSSYILETINKTNKDIIGLFNSEFVN